MYTLTDMAMILMVILYLIFITNIILGGYYDDYGQYVEGELENEELEYFEDDYEDIEDEFDDEEYRKLEMEGHLNNNKTNPINFDDKLKRIRDRNSNKSNNINYNVKDNNLHTVNDEEKKGKQSKEKQTLHDILVYKSFNFLG